MGIIGFVHQEGTETPSLNQGGASNEAKSDCLKFWCCATDCKFNVMRNGRLYCRLNGVVINKRGACENFIRK